MKNSFKLFALATSACLLAGTTACKDFLTAGEVSTDPNRPTVASANRLFVGVQGSIWALLSSDPVRLAGMYTQQFEGANGQYTNLYTYGISESTTGGFYAGLYSSGGLVDVRALEAFATAANDKRYLGIAQVQEAILIGTGADLFGDIVYSQALKGTPNPALDPQLQVYDAVQALLDKAIANLADASPTSVGPGAANDLSYGGSAAKWTKLAHTLKARFYLHTAEVRPAAYASALAESRLGIKNPADNFNAVFSGNANEQNYQYQFSVDQRPGYYLPNSFFVNLLKTRNDPRLSDYFNSDQSDISDERLTPNYTQPLVTANENLLIESEAAYRTGATPEAVTALNAERALTPGLGAVGVSSGLPLLREILTEKYIALFGSIEIWNDYKRTCFPNVAPPEGASGKMPARLLYDTSERNTNTSIPDAAAQPTRNANDPANATDPFGAACLAQ